MEHPAPTHPFTRLAAIAILALALAATGPQVLAGGEAWPGKVVASARDGHAFVFRFRFDDASRSDGCTEIEVAVAYGHVPWYSWLPRVETNHPTKEQTGEAIASLERAQREARTVRFGWVGTGLAPGESRCAYRSRGLQLHRGAVYSFYNPV